VLCEQCGYTLNGLPKPPPAPNAGCPSPLAPPPVSAARRAGKSAGARRRKQYGGAVFAPPLFRTLDMQPSNSKSRAFSFIFLGIASLISVQTMGLHYVLMFTLQAAPDWLPATAWLALPLLLAIALTMHACSNSSP
jgi:hypothetical protein